MSGGRGDHFLIETICCRFSYIMAIFDANVDQSAEIRNIFFQNGDGEGRGRGGDVKDHFKLFFTKSFVLAGDGFPKMRMSNESGTMKADELNCLPSLAGC